MMFGRKTLYYILRYPVLWVMSLFHWPTFIGRENVPQEACVICCNHSGLADPIWAILGLKPRILPWIMTKKSLMSKPILKQFLGMFGAFGVDRDNPDIQAIKKSLKVLKDGEQLLIFPEGTRVKEEQTVAAKSGAVMLANRAGVPVLPVYITRNRKPFRRIKVVIAPPYQPSFEDKKPSAEDLNAATEELMQKIYAME